MGGTKIVVVHIKEIIKSAIFAILGLALIILLIYFFVPKDKGTESRANSLYVPGKYTAEIVLHNSPVNVEVTVSEDEILAVEIKDLQEVQEVFYPLLQPAMQQLATEIVSTQSLDVIPNEEYKVTSKVLVSAIKIALAQAALPIT